MPFLQNGFSKALVELQMGVFVCGDWWTFLHFYMLQSIVQYFPCRKLHVPIGLTHHLEMANIFFPRQSLALRCICAYKNPKNKGLQMNKTTVIVTPSKVTVTRKLQVFTRSTKTMKITMVSRPTSSKQNANVHVEFSAPVKLMVVGILLKRQLLSKNDYVSLLLV